MGARIPSAKSVMAIAPISRSLGFEYINTVVRGLPSSWNAPEAPKKVLTSSTWHAASRNVVHVLPMSVLVALIAINYSNCYMGPTFVVNPEKNDWFMSAIQLFAKMEELLCIASLTAIVMHALRNEVLGDGVPIGLLGSGIWFSSLGSFWSAEFLGTVSWSKSSWRRGCFYLLLIVCGGIAATVGPASAVLMLPREQSVPAGGSSFKLYGSGNEYFPQTVTSASEPEVCSRANATQYAVCPSGGYDSLYSTSTRFTYRTYCNPAGGNAEFNPHCQAKGAEGSRFWNKFFVQSPNNLVPPVLNGFRYGFSLGGGTTAVQPQVATMIMSQALRNAWMNKAHAEKQAKNRQYRWTYELETLGSATSPFVRTKCGNAQNLSADAASAEFPYLIRPSDGGKYTGWRNDTFKSASILSLNRNETSHIRTQRVHLAMDDFGDLTKGWNTTGLLIELPWVYNSRIAIACTITAAWHNSTISSQRSTSYGAFNIDISMDDEHDDGEAPSADESNTPVTLDESWLRLLTPRAPRTASRASNHTFNTLEGILVGAQLSQLPGYIRHTPGICGNGTTSKRNMTDSEIWNKKNCRKIGRTFLPETVAVLVVDGVSRYGSHRVVDMPSDLDDWKPKSLKLFNQSGVFTHHRSAAPNASAADSMSAWMQVYVVGYAYYPSTAADHVALFGVCVYLLLALCHIVCTTFRKGQGTSNAWDSITELLVLNLNSPPPDTSHKLDNTSAGIEQLRTYRAVVKVRAEPMEDEMEAPKLRLVLDDDFPASNRSRAASTGSTSSSSSLHGNYCSTGLEPVKLDCRYS